MTLSFQALRSTTILTKRIVSWHSYVLPPAAPAIVQLAGGIADAVIADSLSRILNEQIAEIQRINRSDMKQILTRINGQGNSELLRAEVLKLLSRTTESSCSLRAWQGSPC